MKKLIAAFVLSMSMVACAGSSPEAADVNSNTEALTSGACSFGGLGKDKIHKQFEDCLKDKRDRGCTLYPVAGGNCRDAANGYDAAACGEAYSCP
jgi:hypothetical protein